MWVCAPPCSTLHVPDMWLGVCPCAPVSCSACCFPPSCCSSQLNAWKAESCEGMQRPSFLGKLSALLKVLSNKDSCSVFSAQFMTFLSPYLECHMHATRTHAPRGGGGSCPGQNMMFFSSRLRLLWLTHSPAHKQNSTSSFSVYLHTNAPAHLFVEYRCSQCGTSLFFFYWWQQFVV